MSRRRYAPDPPVAKKLARLTWDQIEEGRSKKGGWTRATLHAWGIPWPPPTGWQQQLTGEPFNPARVEARDIAVTVFADASYDQGNRVAGWAGWYKASHMEQGAFVSGAITRGLRTNTEAEAIALAMTLAHAVDGEAMMSDVQVMLQSDCQTTLSALLFYLPTARVSAAEANSIPINRPRRASPFMRSSVGVQRIVEIAEVRRLRLVLRHVKSHSGQDTGRTWVHHQCDRLARQHMKVIRREMAA